MIKTLFMSFCRYLWVRKWFTHTYIIQGLSIWCYQSMGDMGIGVENGSKYLSKPINIPFLWSDTCNHSHSGTLEKRFLRKCREAIFGYSGITRKGENADRPFSGITIGICTWTKLGRVQQRSDKPAAMSCPRPQRHLWEPITGALPHPNVTFFLRPQWNCRKLGLHIRTSSLFWL